MTYNPNVPPNPPTPPRGDGGGNRALYFIVGGLVVLAAVFVFIFTNSDGGQDAGTDAAPAAVTEPATPEPATPEPATPAPAPEGNTGDAANQ